MFKEFEIIIHYFQQISVQGSWNLYNFVVKVRFGNAIILMQGITFWRCGKMFKDYIIECHWIIL
jgi:hypothetical protein